MTTYTGLLHWQTAAALHVRRRQRRRRAFRRSQPVAYAGSPVACRRVLRHRFDQTPGASSFPAMWTGAAIPRRGSTWSPAAHRRRSISRTRRWPGACSGRRRCTRRLRRCHLRFVNDSCAPERRTSHAAWADAHGLRARFRAVPVQPDVPRRGHRISVRVVGTRAGRRAAGAQSGADAVDPRYLYAETGHVPARPARCTIVDISPQDREGTLYAFQRSCIQTGDQSAQIPVTRRTHWC